MEFGIGSAPGGHYPPPPLPPSAAAAYPVYPAQLAGYAAQDGYLLPHPVQGYGYPPPHGVGYPAQLAGYAVQNGYPPPHPAGYGYVQPPVQKPQKKKNFGWGLISKFVTGLLCINNLSDLTDNFMGAGDDTGLAEGGGVEF